MERELDYDQACALADLAARVEQGEYVMDRVATELTVGYVDGEPIVRGYTVEDAIARAEAWMRQDTEQTLGGWA